MSIKTISKVATYTDNFSRDKEVQNMLFEEELAIMDYNTSIHLAQEKGEEIGKNLINELNRKLAELGRTDDIIRASSDPQYQKELIRELINANYE